MDLLQPDSIRRAFAAAHEQSGGFDALINNAGAAVFGITETVPLELAREQFQLLVEGPMELIRLALPHMLRNKTGTIINITSLAAVFPIPYMAAYSAAKVALSAYTRCLRLELPLRVVEIQPGDINTGFHNATQRLNAPLTDAVELEPDQVLEGNKGKFQEVVICGFDQNGEIAICSSHGSREALWILERAKTHLMLGTE